MVLDKKNTLLKKKKKTWKETSSDLQHLNTATRNNAPIRYSLIYDLIICIYLACPTFCLHMRAHSVIREHSECSPHMTFSQYELFRDNAGSLARLSF